MTHIFLFLVLVIPGQPQPVTHHEEVETMERCELLAHEFNIAPMPDKVAMAQASCMRVIEKKDKDT